MCAQGVIAWLNAWPVQECLNKCRELLRQSTPVLFFPEARWIRVLCATLTLTLTLTWSCARALRARDLCAHEPPLSVFGACLKGPPLSVTAARL